MAKQEMKASHLTVEEELAQIQRGTEEIFPLEELVSKLERSRREGRPLRVKLGVDPTAADLHLGHVVPAMKLRQFQELGHQAVLIIGDYTAMVGDPTGRNKTRPQLSHEEVLENAKDFTRQLFMILDPERTEVVYNGTWFAKLGFSDVIRLMSRMTVARMIEREDFAERLRQGLPIGLHEMLYPLMQGYDSVMVRADVELGGIDQKFNILVGRELQRDMGQEPQVGVCSPILLGTDGKEKMSKTLGNTIDLLDSPEDKYGKTMSIPDELIFPYFELLTDVPMKTLQQMRADVEQGRLHPMAAKARLARELTARFHGLEAAEAAERHFQRVIQEGQLPEKIEDFVVSGDLLKDGRVWIVRLLVAAGLAPSNSEARRLISQGAVRIQGEVVTDVDLEWVPVRGAVIQVGKRRFVRIQKESGIA